MLGTCDAGSFLSFENIGFGVHRFVIYSWVPKGAGVPSGIPFPAGNM
jgi:hypothetical protein